MSKLIFQRTEKVKDFTISDNHFKYDPRLSAKAKGVFDVILSLPDDWDLNVTHLTGFFSDGVTTIRSAIKELKDFGYLEYHRCQDEQGKLTQHAYVVNERPESCPDICFKHSNQTKVTNKSTAKPDEDSNPINFNKLPDSAFTDKPNEEDPCIGNLNMGKQTLLSTNITKTKENKIKDNELKSDSPIVSTSKKGSLFDIPKEQKKTKPKKKGNELVEYIYTVTDNDKLQEVLVKYFRFRVKRGLNLEQWKLILSDLFEYTTTDQERIRKVESSIAGGFNLLVPDWEKNKPAKKYQSRGFVDNLAGTGANSETHGLTDDERRALIESRKSKLKF